MVARRFGRDVGSLRAISDFVTGYLGAEQVVTTHAFDVHLIIEELFTNMVKYARPGQHDIEIALDRKGAVLTIVLRDFDVEPFDVTQAPPLDTTRPLTERGRGGMGLHLVKQMADSLDYQYQDRTSTITLTKRLES
jgi:anti-sigma regulatory factor (Ser/Thr protein kinase)